MDSWMDNNDINFHSFQLRWLNFFLVFLEKFHSKNNEYSDNNYDNKPECGYGSTVCKCPISSQTTKYMYKFKFNKKRANSPTQK